ncbi:MAG: hypothetical protein ACPG83_04985, partial [Candidatus Poseidoniaceae archaeon]
IFSTDCDYAALKSDGSVITWVDDSSYGFGGGDSSSVSSDLSSGVVEIFATDYAFAALKSDGSVITWGGTDYGGDSSSVSGDIDSNVVAIYGTSAAFAVIVKI